MLRMLFFILPVIIFFGKNGLYNEILFDGGLAVPLSLLFSPLCLFYIGYLRKSLIFALLISYALYCFVLAVLGALIDSVSILYWFQNFLPLLWFILGAVYIESPQHKKNEMYNSFSLGLLFSLLWILTSFIIESFTIGFSGRIMQNMGLPGFYQTYNYLPSAIALSLMLWLYMALDNHKIDIVKLIFYFGLGLFAIAITGSRGPMVAIAVFIIFFTVYTRVAKVYLLVGVSVLIVLALLMNNVENVKLVEKFEIALKSDSITEISSGRDDIIAKYINVIGDNALFGTFYLPPSVFDKNSDVKDKSAHNYYIDTLVRVGFFGLFLFFIFVVAVFHSSYKLLRCAPIKGRHIVIPMFVVLIELFISSNLRVSLKQPITASLLYFSIGILAHQRRELAKNNTYNS